MMAAVKEVIFNCERCTEKSKRKSVRSVVVRPILSSALNNRVQVDMIDYWTVTNSEFKWVLHYKEHLTKFSILRAHRATEAKEVAISLLNIFTTFGAPHVLQSDNGGEFVASVISELTALWPDLVFCNSACHPGQCCANKK